MPQKWVQTKWEVAVLYAFLRLRGEATALKHEKKAPMNHLYWLLMGFGKSYSCYEVIHEIAYIFSVKMALLRHAAQLKRT